jgi:hypothetical protein
VQPFYRRTWGGEVELGVTQQREAQPGQGRGGKGAVWFGCRESAAPWCAHVGHGWIRGRGG